MSQSLLPWVQTRFYYDDGSNRPLSGGSVSFKIKGSQIDAPTFASKNGAQNPNPVPLDINGSAKIWLDSAYGYDVYGFDSEGAPAFDAKDITLVATVGDISDKLDKVIVTPQTVNSSVGFQKDITVAEGLNIQGVDVVDGSAIKIPDNSWIRPQTPQAHLILTNGINPSSTNSTLQLNNGSTLITAGDGTTQTASLQMDASNITLLQDGKPILDATPTETTLFNPSQAASLQVDVAYVWNYLKARFTDGIEVLAGKVKIDTLSAETPIKTLGRNSSNEIIEFDNVIAGGQVNSVVGGLNTDIDNTDTVNPIINVGQNGLDIQGVDAVDSSAIKMPDNSWIRPQTAQQSLIITNGTNPSTTNSTLQLNNGSTLISAGDGTTQTASLQMDASNITLLQGGKPILDATPTATTLFNPSQASAFQIDSTYNWNYLKARFTDGIEVLAGKVKIDTLTAETPIKTLGRNASNEIIEFDNVDLQDAYDNGELITTDATNGALTLKRGSASDTDNVLEVKNGAGTTNASITGDGESTFNGDMTLLSTKNGTWTVDESIRRLNFYSSDTSGSGVGNVGWIDTRVTTTFGTGCDMVFGTAPSGGEATESMRLSRLGDLTVIGDGTFGGSGSFEGSTNIDNSLALTSATFYKKDGFNNWATGSFNSSNDFNIFLYDKTTGAYSSSFIKLTHNTNQIQLQKDTIVSGSIIQGGVTDTGEGLQGTSLSIDGDVTLGGIVDATPTKALGLNASDEVISYAVNVPRVTSVTSTTTLTVDSSTTDQAVITAQSGNLTIASPTGSPVDGQKLIIRVKAVGTSVITWNAIFRQIGTTLPTPTTAGKTIYVACIYNSLDTKWDVVAVAEEA